MCCQQLRSTAGFTLLEALVAVALLAGALTGLAQVIGTSIASNNASRARTYAGVLAGQKIEQLRSLRWGIAPTGVTTTDTTTDTAMPTSAAGGTGLSASPGGTLSGNLTGYVDYIDRSGTTLGGGATPLPGTVYVRRWSITPLPVAADVGLAVRVVVTSVQGLELTRAMALRTRKAP
jgi:type II secretory pathway pseudopilin PulG